MRKETRRIFLSGGGDEEDSKLIDEQFVKALDLSKPTVYIPNAMSQDRYPSCLDWFTSAMGRYGVTSIEMWDDLHTRRPVGDVAGVYIGGGDTVKLLNEIRATGFDRYIAEIVEHGAPLYGGSAGAIIFGEDIRTAPEASNLSQSEAKGLKLVDGYSVMCHYNEQQAVRAQALQEMVGTSVISIPEESGAFICGKNLVNCGSAPIYLYSSDGKGALEAGGSLELK